MKAEITIWNKIEAHPIGDVLAFTVIWKEKKEIYGECYYAKCNDQSQPHIKKFKTDKQIEVHISFKSLLSLEVKNHHKYIIVRPIEDKVITSKSYDGFNPYEEDRFKWKVYDHKDIYMFLDFNNEFIERIERMTK